MRFEIPLWCLKRQSVHFPLPKFVLVFLFKENTLLTKILLFAYLFYFMFLYLSIYGISNIILKNFNVMSFHDPKEQNKEGNDECD